MRLRVLARGFARPPWPWLFAVAAFGLILSASQAGGAALAAVCGEGSVQLLLAIGWRGALAMMLDVDQSARLLMGWALMLVAMMPPLLGAPLMYVWRSSHKRRRVAAMSWFVLGYGAVWMMAGFGLVSLGVVLRLLAGDAAAAAIACLLAMLWSATPWQQRALNRGHRVRHVGMFGWSADLDCLTFGVVHGGWCLASCWAWMLVPLATGSWHLPVMIAVGGAMVAERLARPAEPRWHLPVFLSPLSAVGLSALRQAGLRHG